MTDRTQPRVSPRPRLAAGQLRACLHLAELGCARQTRTRPRRFHAAIEREV